jgi:hypothetical protein
MLSLVLFLLVLSMMLAAPSRAAADGLIVVQVKTDIPAQQNGSSYNGPVATFYSGGFLPAPGFSTTINWGDGTAPDSGNATVSCAPYTSSLNSDCGDYPNPGDHQAEKGTVTGNHTFAKPGPYTITVTVYGHFAPGGGGPYPPADHSTTAQGTIPAQSGTCNILGTLGFARLQTLQGGCVTTNGTQQTTDPGVPVIVNGLELDPASGVSMTLDSATGMLTSNGDVGLKLGSRAQHQTAFKPKPINWRVIPNPGEASIDEGSPGRFEVTVGGLLLDLPALSLDSIKLTDGQSNVSFTVGLPLPALAKFAGGVIKATATMLSDNAGGARFDGLDAEIGASEKPELTGIKVAAPFKAFFGHLKFILSTDTWIVSLIFSVPGAGGISASTQVISGVPTEVHFDASYRTPGLAIGDTGAFLQRIAGGFTHYPHVHRPKIGFLYATHIPQIDAARTSECANYNTYYDQYIALNQPFPSYCGQVGVVDFDPPLEVDGQVDVSAGPVIGTKSAMIVSGGFRYVDSYFDGSNNVPWLFNVQGSVTMVGLPFNRTPAQVYGTTPATSRTSYVPVNNAGKQAWATIHGDGLIEAGGGFNYTFPQLTSSWFLKVDGEIAVSLIPNGAAIGSPPAGATAEQYAGVVQSRANGWGVVGTITGSICAQIPTVASACATGAAGISNHGVAGCASFSVPGTQVLQTIARAGAAAINAVAEFGQNSAVAVAQAAVDLGNKASQAAQTTGQAIQSTTTTVVNGAAQLGSTIGSGTQSAVHSAFGWAGLSADKPRAIAAALPVAHAASVVDANITIPDVNFAIGAVYNWATRSTSRLSTCSHDALLGALASRDRARISAAGGVQGIQVRVGPSGAAPRLFVIQGATAAPDVIVMGPDRRAIRTKGPGFVEPGWIVYKDPAQRLTYVDAVAAPRGKWDFVAVPGSSKLVNVKTSAGVPIPSVRAVIKSAAKGRFAIAYITSGIPRGDVVTLVETDGSGRTATIAKLRRTKGSVRWVPSLTLAGSKRVVLAVIKRGTTEVSVQPLDGLDLGKVAKPKVKGKKQKH